MQRPAWLDGKGTGRLERLTGAVTQATDLSITPVEPDRLIAALPAGNPLLIKDQLQLIDLADQRLYKAKNTGRNRIIL